MRSLHAWVFDMDGTLTVPMHDFAAMRRSIGVPETVNLLEGIMALPAEARDAAFDAVARWEWEHAERATAAPGAVELLDALRSAGARVGILTRNLRPIALRTLEVIGLRDYFHDDDVLGRESAVPKPAPDGVQHLLSQWDAQADHAVMVGDYIHDAQAGRAAGVQTILVAPSMPAAWHPYVDHGPTTLVDVLAQWQRT